MKKPRLTNYSTEALIGLGNLDMYSDIRDDIRKIVSERLTEESYKSLYKKFKRSGGLLRVCIGDALLNHQVSDGYFIEPEVLTETLDRADVDSIWNLSAFAVNPMVKEEAEKRLLKIIDKSIEERKCMKKTKDIRNINYRRII